MPGGQHAAPLTSPEEIALWEAIIAHQNQTFTTSGRGSRPGKPFTYSIHGAEMLVTTVNGKPHGVAYLLLGFN